MDLKRTKSIPSDEKKILGLVERVRIVGSKGSVEVEALLDTGATRSSVGLDLAAKVGLGPILGSMKVKSQTDPNGHVRRAIIGGKLIIRGVEKDVKFTLADRDNMATPILIGRDVIHSDFIVDIEKTHNSPKMSDRKKKGEK